MKIGPNVVLGKNVVIKDGCEISNSTIMEGSVVEEGCCIHDCIVGWNNLLSPRVHLDHTYTGDDVRMKPEIELVDYVVLPNKTVAESNPVVKKVILLNVCCYIVWFFQTVQYPFFILLNSS